MGCQIEPLKKEPEKWRVYEPLSDGSGCHCYDYFGANCVATCASNIMQYEIKSTYVLRGSVQVQCSQGQQILGCGVHAYETEEVFEKFRAVFASSDTACQCYDNYGAKCFAVCGRLSSGRRPEI